MFEETKKDGIHFKRPLNATNWWKVYKDGLYYGTVRVDSNYYWYLDGENTPFSDKWEDKRSRQKAAKALIASRKGVKDNVGKCKVNTETLYRFYAPGLTDLWEKAKKDEEYRNWFSTMQPL